RKVLETLFRNGTLEKLPSQHKKRLIVLEQFAIRFEPGCRYSELEVTGIIKPLFDDYCTIRRLLVDEGMIQRDGLTYWREIMDVGQDVKPAIPLMTPTAKKMSERSELKRQYKQSRPDMGVYQIRNKVNGRIFIDSSKNLKGSEKSRLFQLKMGKIVFSPGLQKDLNEFGANNFEFSVLDVLPNPASGENVERLLLALKLQWQKKLQPFGDQGYNSLKGYQREREQ
ncbi:MAG: DUF2087 domain-containing protein, partial [Geobacteraceae bacterium]|nr:DUF2087 domain-containing protein [Geobacteraceae bacterium]